MILNYIWKFISGWINYSGKVISHKIIERAMGYRGSKSVLKSNIVKEQRVDGSWLVKTNLRCILMGFERNYQIKIPSNHLNKKRFANYSTNDISNLNTNLNKLNPWFITGFADAESSFGIFILPRSDSTTKWRVKAVFAIGLNKKDINILRNIQYTLGVGKLYFSGMKVYYRVESFSELQVIVDHFSNYKLVSAKISDFLIFKQCFNLIKNQEHLTSEGLLKLVELKSSLNLGLSDTLKKSFPNLVPTKLPNFIFNGIKDPNWISGFISGDGSFNIKTTKTEINKVQLRFSIHLHLREKEVILGITGRFG